MIHIHTLPQLTSPLLGKKKNVRAKLDYYCNQTYGRTGPPCRGCRIKWDAEGKSPAGEATLQSLPSKEPSYIIDFIKQTVNALRGSETPPPYTTQASTSKRSGSTIKSKIKSCTIS